MSKHFRHLFLIITTRVSFIKITISVIVWGLLFFVWGSLFSLQDNTEEVSNNLNYKNLQLILMLVIKGINKDHQYLQQYIGRFIMTISSS